MLTTIVLAALAAPLPPPTYPKEIVGKWEMIWCGSIKSVAIFHSDGTYENNFGGFYYFGTWWVKGKALYVEEVSQQTGDCWTWSVILDSSKHSGVMNMPNPSKFSLTPYE